MNKISTLFSLLREAQISYKEILASIRKTAAFTSDSDHDYEYVSEGNLYYEFYFNVLYGVIYDGKYDTLRGEYGLSTDKLYGLLTQKIESFANADHDGNVVVQTGEIIIELCMTVEEPDKKDVPVGKKIDSVTQDKLPYPAPPKNPLYDKENAKIIELLLERNRSEEEIVRYLNSFEERQEFVWGQKVKTHACKFLFLFKPNSDKFCHLIFDDGSLLQIFKNAYLHLKQQLHKDGLKIKGADADVFDEAALLEGNDSGESFLDLYRTQNLKSKIKVWEGVASSIDDYLYTIPEEKQSEALARAFSGKAYDKNSTPKPRNIPFEEFLGTPETETIPKADVKKHQNRLQNQTKKYLDIKFDDENAKEKEYDDYGGIWEPHLVSPAEAYEIYNNYRFYPEHLAGKLEYAGIKHADYLEALKEFFDEDKRQKEIAERNKNIKINEENV